MAETKSRAAFCTQYLELYAAVEAEPVGFASRRAAGRRFLTFVAQNTRWLNDQEMYCFRQKCREWHMEDLLPEEEEEKKNHGGEYPL